MRRIVLQFTLLLVALLLLGLAARAVFQPDPRDALRPADALFLSGRYHDARAAYAAVAARWPQFAPGLLRLGVVAALRDERVPADQAFLAVIGAGASAEDVALIRLYQGQLAARAGQPEQARQFWGQVAGPGRLLAVRHLLEAEQRLAGAEYAAAESAYRKALDGQLPAGWRALARARLALLRASSDTGAARALLAPEAGAADRPPADAWLEPLRPTDNPPAEQLQAALDAPREQQAQLLGQVYLDARLYPLAETQFGLVPPDSQYARAAAAYAAYTRWSAGDRAEGLRQLQALAARDPADARALALLALALLSSRDDQAAQAQLEAVRALAPRAPDTHLAWAQWHMAQHDYVAAAESYRLALGSAPPEQQGAYALALARFHVDTAFQVCGTGLGAAETATRMRPDDPRAWTVLSAARLTCELPEPARMAAARALQLAPADAEAAYYLGRALAQLGQRAGARQALIQAADSAPASQWRARAEQQLELMGL